MPSRLLLRAIALLTLMCSVIVLADSQQPRPRPDVSDDRGGEKPGIEHLFDALSQVRTFKETVVSPDGKTLAWVESIPDKKAAAGSSAIYLVDWQNTAAKPRRLTAGDGRTAHAEHSLTWS